jgi:hypothetical protein
MTLYHASNHLFKPSELVDPKFSKKGRAYATTDPVFAVFAASERYKYRKTLSDGIELAPDTEDIYLYEVVPVDWSEDIMSKKEGREHVAVSEKGFVIIKRLDT